MLPPSQGPAGRPHHRLATDWPCILPLQTLLLMCLLLLLLLLSLFLLLLLLGMLLLLLLLLLLLVLLCPPPQCLPGRACSPAFQYCTLDTGRHLQQGTEKLMTQAAGGRTVGLAGPRHARQAWLPPTLLPTAALLLTVSYSHPTLLLLSSYPPPTLLIPSSSRLQVPPASPAQTAWQHMR